MPGGLRAKGAVVCVLATSALLGSQAGPATAAKGAAVPVLRWTDCGGGFQCSRARVPLDYGRPYGPQVSLALIRLPAQDRARRIGSLFTNPGGPGSSGVDFVRSAARTAYPKSVRARFDIVGFDPRGVADSTPVRCFATEAASSAFFDRLPPFPVTAGEERSFTAAMADLGRRCGARSTALLAHVSTADVARDLDLLRQAVGDPRLTFAGYSYGTLIGATYANLFPGRFRALVLDAVVDPPDYMDGHRAEPVHNRLGTPEASAAALRAFLELCDEARRRCAFSAGSPKRELARTLARLRSRPAVVRTPAGRVSVSYALAVGVIEQYLYVPAAWPQLAGFLALVSSASTSGAPTGTADLRALPSAARRSGQAGYDNEREAGLAVMCGETTSPRDPAAWPALARQADARAPYVGAFWTWQSLPCATWPVRAANRYAGPWDRPTAATVLVVGNRGDPATPYAGARRLSRRLANARLLTLDGYGHGALGQSRCVNEYVARYLVDATLPPRRATCRPDAQPFRATAPIGLTFPAGGPILAR